MATRIIEYNGLPQAWPIVPAIARGTAQSALTATASSQQSAAFGDATEMVIVQSDEAIKVKFGTNPTATDNDYLIAAGQEQAFQIRAGAQWKVAIKT